ncbi:transporter substrate-binding domain-containing protein [Bosea sp. LjRoot9]|uniref:transporter substrate-binding domain-containing protein n=1 Tax=Bosea sp. LjRoot9 TaxID=3342341 RepID=UPI003ECE9C0F
MKITRSVFALAAALGLSTVVAPVQAQERKLETVKKRGTLKCSGHNSSFLGFAEVDDKGNWKGMDIELCRALSAAIFGTSNGHLEIVPISWAQRWPSLQSGELDVVIKISGWTQSRDTELNLSFSNPYFMGEYKIMVPKALGVAKIADLKGGSICVAAGTSQERILAAALQTRKVSAEVLSFGKSDELSGAYFGGRCDGYMEFAPTLAIARSAKAKKPEDHILLEDTLTLEAESIVVTEADPKWLDIQNWMISSLFFAELEGITKTNVDERRANPTSTEVSKFLGVTPGYGSRLGLSDDWAYKMIKEVGNYAEIYGRTVGDQSPYKLPRGKNALYNANGVFFPLLID